MNRLIEHDTCSLFTAMTIFLIIFRVYHYSRKIFGGQKTYWWSLNIAYQVVLSFLELCSTHAVLILYICDIMHTYQAYISVVAITCMIHVIDFPITITKYSITLPITSYVAILNYNYHYLSKVINCN